MGFPAEAICSGQQVRDRTDISMTKDLFKSGGSCFPPSPPPPPPSALLHAPGLLPRGAPQLDCKKRDHFKETRCARVSLAARTPITSSRLSSLSQSPPFSPIPTERERSDFSSSLAFRALPCASVLHPHAAQTVGASPGLETNQQGERKRTAPVLLLQLAERGGAQNTERSAAETRTGSWCQWRWRAFQRVFTPRVVLAQIPRKC